LYLLDTTTASAAIRGALGVDRRLARLDPGNWRISSITRSERRLGVELRPAARKLALLVDAFLAVASTASWDDKAADEHGKLRAALRTRGEPIGDFDEMIAAHALALDAVLVTDNIKHFCRVPRLLLESWC
jgi:tRNA(fMet)-specific endonuclease VapC